MIHLRSISIERDDRTDAGSFPFAIPAVKTLPEIKLTSAVTLFVGENGSGKSTLLEALAWAVGSVTAGSESIDSDSSLEHVRPLGQALRVVWNKRTRRGFFLRAEDFFGYVKGVKDSLARFKRQNERVRAENIGLPEGELARIAAPFSGSARELETRYGADMDAQSHGEQFISFFQTRLVPGGLYLLDEPEVPLSPIRQLALLSLIKESADERDCQFIIATHSPILMAVPGATILSFDENPVRPVQYEDVEQVTVMRDFLNRPDSYLKHL